MPSNVHKVYNKPVLDKLWVNPDSQVFVVGVKDENFWKQLTERANRSVKGRLLKNSDIIFFGAERKQELANLKKLRSYLKPDGAIWVVSRKRKEAALKDVDVIAAAKLAALVDNKVVSFSETHTALRLVIPIMKRTH